MRLIISALWLALAATTVDASPSSQTGPGLVTIEYVAHACFRIISPAGNTLLIDPYQSRWWLGYDFPAGPVEVDAVLVSHPHPDHDGGWSTGKELPWSDSTAVIRTPGTYRFGDISVAGIAGKHAEPYGKEFGQTNTIWLVEIGGFRIVHIGDNGPITESIAAQLGQVDVLMLPIDAEYHILKHTEIEAWRERLAPRLLVPMHYRHPDLETDPDSPSDLGDIDAWLESQQGVRRLASHRLQINRQQLPSEPQVLVFKHSASE